MSAPYDATTKDLIETDPAGWVTYLGGTARPSAVGLIDADLSTVTTAADKVIRIDEPFRWLLHVELQSSSDALFERRLLQYTALLHHRHGVPVATAVVLRKAGNMKWLNGCLSVAPPVGPSWEFRYQVVRVWERPAREFLNGPLGLLPLAPLSAATEDDLPMVIDEMRGRIDAQHNRPLAAKLWAATYLLMGLRFDDAIIDRVLSGVSEMEESTTYQALLHRGREQGVREGRTEGLQESIRVLGAEKFGAPSAEHDISLAAITDPARLTALSKKLLHVNTWDELLAGA